jgi:capsular exopolysaccharide synthesis family protein
MADPLAAEPLGGQTAEGPDLIGLLQGVLRRWRMVLLVWLLLTPLGIAAVWYLVKPYYTATALVQVAPAVQAILYPDATPSIPNYDTYLNTQAQIIASRHILTAALADPSVKDVPLQQTANPVSTLQKNLAVSTVSRTQLLEIAVSQENRGDAIRLARAVLAAYMTQAVDQDTVNAVRRREALAREQQDLRTHISDLTDRIRQLAEQAGTASDAIFDLRRQSLEQSIADAKQKLEQLDEQILDLQGQLRQLDQAALPEDLAAQRELLIDEDSGVRYVRKDIADKTATLARLQLPDDHKGTSPAQKAMEQRRIESIAAVQQNLAQLQAELERQRTRAAAAADSEIQRKHAVRLQDGRLRLSAVLASLQQRRDLLQDRIRARDTEGMSVGRQGLEIQNLSEQRAQAKLDYDRVSDALKQLEIESQRPTRISAAAEPEVRPEGIKDRRMKFSLVVMMMAAGLACGLGLLRELLDPHIHNTEQAQAGVGLRMLGAVPSVKELQAGRITKEHFLESYRLIRASLSSLGSEGNPPRSMLITSAQAAEGKTSLAVSLAISLAEPGARVLLIDGDIQSPQISRLLSVKPHGNLRQVLLGERELSHCITHSGIKGLDILAGHSNGQTARSVLNMRSAQQVLRQAVEAYDHVVVDSPPALGAADSLVWARAVEGVIVTSLLGYSDRKAIRIACQRLTSVGARLLGSVVANVSMKESYYSYSTTSCRGEGSLALPHRGGPSRRSPLLVSLHKPDAP